MRRSFLLSIFILLLSSCTTSAPTQTPTSQPAMSGETPTRTNTSRPEPSVTLTQQATRTPLPLETYYDAEFGITLGYPDAWEMVAPRHFEGADGYLTIRELKGYHTYSKWHACNDYAFTHGFPNTTVPYPPGCVIIPSSPEQPAIFIFAYSVSGNGPHYLVLETPIDYFTLIANSIERDNTKNIYLSNKNNSIPAPIEGNFSSSVSVRESYLDVAVYDWSVWNLHNISFANSIWESNNWDNTNMSKICGPELLTEDGMYTSSTNNDIIEIYRDAEMLFTEEAPYPNYGMNIFCVWNGLWFFET